MFWGQDLYLEMIFNSPKFKFLTLTRLKAKKGRNMHLGAWPSLFRNAYELRKNPTEAEEIL
jgi:hypothetical protein